MRKIFWLLGLALLSWSLPALAEEKGKAPLKVGDQMFDFTMKDGLSGKDVNFTSDIKGKADVIAIVFFNTGCSACMAEMDEMSKAVKELGEGKLKLYGIAVDKRGEQAVKAYNEIYRYLATYLLDPTFSMPPKFGFNFTPASLLLNREGTVVFLRGGYNPVTDSGLITEEIKKHLK
jgi:peroxiredoxin